MRDAKGNPVGSREAFVLSQRCEEIILGTVLGDGCLERNGSNVRLRIDHCSTQRALVDWKFRELRELGPLAPRLVERWDKRTGHRHVNYRFSTRTTQVLNRFHHLFYGFGREKRVPDSMRDLLNSSLSLAVWYMDDGGRRGDCASGYLNTNAYSVKDVEILKLCLRANFGIESKTHFAAGKPRIYIPVSHFGTFCDLIRPHVISEMEYKLL
jgi:hypothetical protein